MPDIKKLLLLNCFREFHQSLPDKYVVHPGGLFIPPIKCPHHNPFWIDVADYATCPEPPYNYNIIVYSPTGPLVVPAKTPKEPLPDWGKTIVDAGRIAIIFLNQVTLDYQSEVSKRHDLWNDGGPGDIDKKQKRMALLAEVQRPCSLPEQVYKCICPWMQLGDAVDTESDFANNRMAELLKPVLESFVDKMKDRWSPITGFGDSQNTEWTEPILVNPIGQPHAFWIRQGKGGVLFLPGFKDNLAVLKSLLELPVSDLLEIDPDIPKTTTPIVENATVQPDDVPRHATPKPNSSKKAKMSWPKDTWFIYDEDNRRVSLKFKDETRDLRLNFGKAPHKVLVWLWEQERMSAEELKGSGFCHKDATPHKIIGSINNQLNKKLHDMWMVPKEHKYTFIDYRGDEGVFVSTIRFHKP